MGYSRHWRGRTGISRWLQLREIEDICSERCNFTFFLHKCVPIIFDKKSDVSGDARGLLFQP